MDKQRATIQVIWGAALVLMGIAVIFRIPQVMPRLMQIESLVPIKGFLYFCFYFLAVALIYGGGRKLFENYKDLFKKGE